jgi:hypothetical protein
MRSLLLLAALAAGCSAPPAALPLREECRLGAWLALHVARLAPPLKVPSPDKPDQGDACSECGGTGKLGDGVIALTCGACNGTGRKPAAAFDTPASAAAFQAEPQPLTKTVKAAPAAPKDGRTYRKVCRNGVCTWEPVQ